MTSPTSSVPPAAAAVLRTRALPDNPALAARAVQMLQSLQGFWRLELAHAQAVLPYLREVSFQRGEVLLRTGDHAATGHLLLVLEGEVSVQVELADRAGAGGPSSVLGAGAILGEMALLDGAPRSATCTALTPVLAAGLARRGLELLMAEQPAIAARLMAGIAQQMADRLRGVAAQLQIYAQLNDGLREQLIQLQLRASV